MQAVGAVGINNGKLVFLFLPFFGRKIETGEPTWTQLFSCN